MGSFDASSKIVCRISTSALMAVIAVNLAADASSAFVRGLFAQVGFGHIQLVCC
jgi:hypothetical protein